MASDPGTPAHPPAWVGGSPTKRAETMSTISAIGERRRALELLSRSPTGCTETLMLAHGFSAEMLGRLVVDGFAGVQRGIILAGERQLMVNWMEITDLGHIAISDAVSGR
jgi:hypothetical protein